jgi:5-methylcytosine-specific restriction endonuclease McrA
MGISPRQYRLLLKDNKWKHKAKEIRARDRNLCVKCGAKGRLQVHHLYYVEDKMPWEYPNDALVTLCSVCHRKEHGIKIKPKRKKVAKPTVKKAAKKKALKKKIKLVIETELSEDEKIDLIRKKIRENNKK